MISTASIAIMFCLIFTGSVVWAQHQGETTRQSCGYCGMDRQKFAHTAMTIEYEDGTTACTCSLHCAAVDLALNIDKTPKQIQVGDAISKQPIDAATACWTIGGDQPGVMTKRAKWAFSSKDDCEKYASEHGAVVTDFDEAVKAAYEDMYTDTKMIRERRKARRNQMGQQPPPQEKPSN
jgi:nitrous oxide reductase accessory protein NosL